MAGSTTRETATRRLVIVESPAKARTIAGYLGPGYDVEASVGHIRDLAQPSELPAEMKKGPYGKFAVDVENGFDPYYVVDADKKKKVAELRRLLKDADELLLATDEDREGEAIAWHLVQALQPKVPYRRLVFHEITREAIQRALLATRQIDDRLVDAQETRRILDRLYGYELSPVLWRKVATRLSAGRVQSVATRLIVERERARMAFRSASYADLLGLFAPEGDSPTSFNARLVGVDGARVASGRDFADTGALTASGVLHLDLAAAEQLAADLDGVPVTVRNVEEKPYTRRPAAPFTTSTLQQEASRKLRLSSRRAMRVAQSLYEGGYITYMRTDSTVLSEEALTAARTQAEQLYGPDFVPQAARRYASKSKNAQEAHEAVRPAGDVFRTPAQVAGELQGDEFRLYDLVWKRTVASQMKDARGTTASVRLGSAFRVRGQERDAEFAASGTVITFRGFLAAYEEGRDETRHHEDGDSERRLPALAVGDPLTVLELLAQDHQTSPPPRYTEASLVKALEELGIGRPSTYASTISTIQDRGYSRNRGAALVPTWLAFAVTKLLEQHFPRLVDYDFTAQMESDLDAISRGEAERVAWLTRFYLGDPEAGEELAKGVKGLADDLGQIDAREISTVEIGDGIVLRVGRYGPYLEEPGRAGEGEQRRASVPDDVAPDELTVAKARELLETQADGDRVLGVDPESGREIVVKAGRYGPYVTEVLPEGAKGKPRTGSLFTDMQPDTVSLEDALRLLSLPRVVGVDPESGAQITAQNGRYGPYLKKGTDSRSLTSEDQIFDVTLDQALEIYRQPRSGRGRATQAPLRELGDDPVSGKPVVVKEGRFGPYVTDGTANATLRKDDDPQEVSLQRAAELLAEKRAKAPSTGRRTTARSGKATATKTATKPAETKTAATKTAATKSAATKTAKVAETKTATKPAAPKAQGKAPRTRSGTAGTTSEPPGS